MKFSEALVLLAAGTVGGIFSTVVSIASLITYPALLALGVPPLSANMTNTVSLVLTGAGAVAGSRPELTGQGRRVLRLGVITALGGAAGAAVLLATPGSTFTKVVPVLIGAASLILLAQPKVRNLRPQLSAGDEGQAYGGAGGGASGSAGVPGETAPPGSGAQPGLPVDRRSGWALGHGAALFAVAMYVGYFGAAAGIMLLVVLSTMISEPLVKVNAVKNAVSGMANAMAAVCFALFGDVRWQLVVPLAAGFLIGGWVGPKIARLVPAGALRVLVSMAGLGLAVRLGVSAYG